LFCYAGNLFEIMELQAPVGISIALAMVLHRRAK
jgi:hypothetical protein